MKASHPLFGRNLPELMKLNSGKQINNHFDFERRREEIKTILQEEEYGYIPPRPDHLSVELENEDSNFCAGKCIRRDLTFTVTFKEKTFSFPVISSIPKLSGRIPAFIFINFTAQAPDKYLPSEEICDNGFAVFSFCYSDITSNDANFKNGIAPLFRRTRARQSAPGKIAMWAWAAMRVMDYVQTLNQIDTDNIAIIGHSTLGKSALLAGGFDDRFKYVISNDSGCSGAAIMRGKCGESVSAISNAFPFLFCPRYTANAAKFEERGYDQHFLLALCAPRHLMIGSAEEDILSDPKSEFLSAYAASEAYRIYGFKGLSSVEGIPKAKSVICTDRILYQYRHGAPYMSREDWAEYINYIKGVIQVDK